MLDYHSPNKINLTLQKVAGFPNLTTKLNVLKSKRRTKLLIYNPGQKCWEGSVTFEIAPLPPLSMLDFAPNKMVTFLPTLNMGEGGGRGEGARACSFPNSSAPIVRIIELGVK